MGSIGDIGVDALLTAIVHVGCVPDDVKGFRQAAVAMLTPNITTSRISYTYVQQHAPKIACWLQGYQAKRKKTNRCQDQEARPQEDLDTYMQAVSNMKSQTSTQPVLRITDIFEHS